MIYPIVDFDIQQFSGAPFYVRVIVTLALWALVWAVIWVRPTEKPSAKPTVTMSATPTGNANSYQSAGAMTVHNYGLDTKQLEELLKKLNASNDPEDKPYPGLAFYLVCDFNEQNEQRRKFVFDFGTSKERGRFSAYLTEDNALAFRVIDQTGETNTIRVPRSAFEMKTFSGWLFEIGKLGQKSFLRISRDGKRLQSAVVNYPIDESVFSFGGMASFADMDGKNNGSGSLATQRVFSKTLTSAEQTALIAQTLHNK